VQQYLPGRSNKFSLFQFVTRQTLAIKANFQIARRQNLPSSKPQDKNELNSVFGIGIASRSGNEFFRSIQ
jgi:hypothetical protein